MLPDNTLSTEVIPGKFSGGRFLTQDSLTDYETGGIALNDPSEGLLHQVWRVRVRNNNTEVEIDAQNVAPTTILTGTNITEVSLAFDQNMNPSIAYVDDGVPKFYWYDSTVPGMVTTDYVGIINPRVCMDDKRESQSTVNDVILAYLRNGALYYRQQRDRYTVEYDPTEMVPEPERTNYRALIATSPGLIKIGMNDKLRLQFMLRNPV